MRIAASLFLLGVLTLSTTSAQTQDKDTYRVVINHEEQYAIWFADWKAPSEWKDTGVSGSEEKCMAYIEEVWTDMRPLSLRKKMAEAGVNPDKAMYSVVINHEEQYSLWVTDWDNLTGWKATGFSGSLEKSQAYIEEVWTDMRPLSLRKKMKEAGID